LYFSSK